MPMMRMENSSLNAFIKRVEDEEDEVENGEKQGWTGDWGKAEWRFVWRVAAIPFWKKRGLLIYFTFPFFPLAQCVTSQNLAWKFLGPKQNVPRIA
jgi:hypothetical protein